VQQPASNGSCASAVRLLPADEVLVHVIVYCSGKTDVVLEEAVLLGSQKLSDLRDIISCAAETKAASEPTSSSAAASTLPSRVSAEAGSRAGLQAAVHRQQVPHKPTSHQIQLGGADGSAMLGGSSAASTSSGAYFFFEGMFCNDTRNAAGAVDYSKPIVDMCR
jgi:hypothetical protein